VLQASVMSLAILFHFLCVQHVSDINISIIRSLGLFCWITTMVVLFLVRYLLEFRCGWVGVVSVLQASVMSLAILFHFLCVQHVSDINISIIRSLRLFCWITTMVVLFLVRYLLEFRLKPATRIPLQHNHTETPTHIEPRTIWPMW